ncbi:MAG: hypothetical protein QOF72_678, partial [Blastocatellia bacterium]|nr:hypothetical protein [Blastocatellia bacterium]
MQTSPCPRPSPKGEGEQLKSVPLTMGTIAQNDLYRLIGEANAR